MKHLFATLLLVLGVVHAKALVISEVMSNPTGDDSGREWFELYNDTVSDVDLSTLTVSIKGGTAVVATPLQGGTTLAPGAYAIIASVVSGQTKFLQDFANFSGVLLKSSISLVNTGSTSIDVKLNGAVAASLSSYTPAKEGSSLSLIGGTYVTGNPTPGTENQAVSSNSSSSSSSTSSSTTTDTQVTVAQATPPSPDIVIYLPSERLVVAGAETPFTVSSMTRAGKSIDDVRYTWAFGDGGQGTGSSTNHIYAYSGRYIAQVEALSTTVYGTARMTVRVVPPDVTIKGYSSGKYGSYIDITNPNMYDLDLSQWILSINGSGYPFPKNTILPADSTTHFTGVAMGFASTTLTASSAIKILFPTLEEVTHFTPQEALPQVAGTSTTDINLPVIVPKIKIVQKLSVSNSQKSQQQSALATSTLNHVNTTTPKDTRIVSWIKRWFN